LKLEAKLIPSTDFGLSQVPEVKEGLLYLFLLQSEWHTQQRKAIENNLHVFSEKLGENIIIPIEDKCHREELRGVLKSDDREEPTILVTPIHPSKWPAVLTADRAIQLRIGKLSDYNEVVNYLQAFIKIMENHSGDLDSISWMDKVQRIKSISKKVPVLNLTGLFFAL
jgi:hypothetical protein